MANTITADEIREQFSQAMSAMYQQEVPQYGTLLELVADVNLAVLENNPRLHEQLANADELARLNVERHGAIRVGTAEELATLRRMFAIMGMYPVSYYDLSQAGVPVHSTAFRPVDDAALARNPFRIFTSLLRLELIASDELRQRAAQILAKRDIFTPRCRELIAQHEERGAFTPAEAREFVREALETFRWHSHATVDDETYHALQNEHRLIAHGAQREVGSSAGFGLGRALLHRRHRLVHLDQPGLLQKIHYALHRQPSIQDLNSIIGRKMITTCARGLFHLREYRPSRPASGWPERRLTNTIPRIATAREKSAARPPQNQ